MLGNGVVPAALFAAASTNDVLTCGELIVTLVLTVAARSAGKSDYQPSLQNEAGAY